MFKYCMKDTKGLDQSCIRILHGIEILQNPGKIHILGQCRKNFVQMESSLKYFILPSIWIIYYSQRLHAF